MAERERACDEAVLLQGNEPEIYAEGILKICELSLEPSLPCISGVTGSNLKMRIEEVMSHRIGLALSLGKKTLLAAAGAAALVSPFALGLLNGPAILAQSTVAGRGEQPRPSEFEVASLKPNPGCANNLRGGNLSPSPGRLEMTWVTLQSLIQSAYGTFGDGVTVNTQPLHMEGGPSWMRADFYSLSAKADGPVRTEMLAGPMLQTFLAERFHLKVHNETREMPVYVLTLAKGGLKVQPLAEGACTPIDLTHPPAPPKPGELRPKLCGAMMIGPAHNGEMMIEVQGSTMTQFAQRLSGRVDRTVFDKTGIGGKFNFHLEFTPDPQMPGQQLPPSLRPDPGNPTPLSPSDSGPNLFTALEEQLGLKLQSDKGPVEVLVIDHVERPTEN
ncbi:MAG: TIGR03435 family protein [Acidobacteriia bacterium]|nr:TIGR03435 family protein [Terriglobia bacterium]